MAETISLSLVSHTNVGKTTLARTLLAADVGEVRDAPHVTEFADEHELLRSPDGDRLTLWDTPGFGDSARLARRLRQSGNPIGWFLGEVWDRWRDRPFWASQQALRNVRERALSLIHISRPRWRARCSRATWARCATRRTSLNSPTSTNCCARRTGRC